MSYSAFDDVQDYRTRTMRSHKGVQIEGNNIKFDKSNIKFDQNLSNVVSQKLLQRWIWNFVNELSILHLNPLILHLKLILYTCLILEHAILEHLENTNLLSYTKQSISQKVKKHCIIHNILKRKIVNVTTDLIINSLSTRMLSSSWW